MDPVEKINLILERASAAEANSPHRIFINSIHNEFYQFENEFIVPKISVRELSYDTAAEILRVISGLVPEYISSHRLLEERDPPAEQHFIHLIKFLRGKTIDFAHVFKIDLKFSGDPGAIIDRGNSGFYPSYRTSRVYFKSILVPVIKGSDRITPVRLTAEKSVDTDLYFHTYAIFDEEDNTSASKKICAAAGTDKFSASVNLYPMISYDYFTAALNVPEPFAADLTAAAEIFEPLFHFIYAEITGSTFIPAGYMAEIFKQEISFFGRKPSLTEEYAARLKSILGRYALYRDDQMALRGVWRFDPVD